ncbi:MAG: hypothetical protein J3K34DRAFT_488825 [Monoraphidium minutum]|nr:MAG: hypothetical protein J3K34DRAFT_488825 [Monoraphidium minutum]
MAAHARAAAAAASALLLLLLAAGPASAAPAWDGDLTGAEREPTGAGRKLRQFGCLSKPLIIAHGAVAPTDIRPLLDEAPPLPKIPVTSAQDVQLVSLVDAASCIRTAPRAFGAIVVWDDGSIPDLSAMGALRSVSGPLVLFGVGGNSSVASLDGLANLESAGGLTLAHMNRVRDLSGLGRLSVLAEDMVIWDNNNLTSLCGLGPVAELYSRLWVDTNPLLTDLTGLDSLSTVFFDVVIRGNPLLRTLDGLGALRTVGGEVALINNFNLTSTAGLKSLASIGISLAVLGHPVLEDLAGFSRLGAVPGDLVIYETSLQSLGELARVTSVGLSCVIGINPDLESLEGLASLQSVGGQLSISYNDRLTDLRGLGSLQAVGRDLFVRKNANLTSLSDLGASLRSVGAALMGDLVISDNPNLVDLAGLGAPGGALSEVAGAVVVERNGAGLPQAQTAALAAAARPRELTAALPVGGS